MRLAPVLALAAFGLASLASAQRAIGPLQNELDRDFFFQENEDGSILAADVHGTELFASFQEYFGSRFFLDHGLRCGSERLPQFYDLGTTADCNSSNTTIKAEYDPAGGVTYTIPVWVHILMNKRGTLGVVSDTRVTQQIAALNRDYASLTETKIRFVHAGTTRSRNNNWYNDAGSYYNQLAVDVLNNLNIYTNTAGGYLGYSYVPSGGGVVGNKFDRVVIYHAAFGDPAPYGPPYDEGKTATHEVGHYLGLYHTFDGGCAAQSGCANNGDLICDTQPEASPHFSGCTDPQTCGNPDPIQNFMDYTDDFCMDRFSPNQANRMRCTIANFRPQIPQ
jgi:pregnancy-associated plasma protein-A